MWTCETKYYDTRLGLALGAVGDFLQYCFDKDYLDGKRHMHHLPLLPFALVATINPIRTKDGKYILSDL